MFKKKKNLPLIARVNLAELKKEREQNMQLGDVSILAKEDYTKRIPKIRLYYVALEKYSDYDGNIKICQTYGISSPFILPHNMTIQDACKVVSYLSDKVEKEYNLEPASEKSVAMVSRLLNKYGFEKIESREHGHYHAVSEYIPFRKLRAHYFTACEKIEGVVDLFTVGGNFKVFKKSDLSRRYFNWYIENVTEQDVKNVYKNINCEYILDYNEKSL